MSDIVWQTDLDGLPEPKRGKVRDIYDLGHELLIVACDRISAYDHVLHPGIPGKGKILSQLTNFWFDHFSDLVPNHLLATEATEFPSHLRAKAGVLQGRSVWVKKAQVVPFECVARGYLAGSGYREYKDSGEICGIPLPPGLRRAERLPRAIFTPATKAESGHDENVSFDRMCREAGEELARKLRQLTLDLYEGGAELAAKNGIILADTKFEFGLVEGEILLVDEVLTPDSSRFWDADRWQPGVEPVSLDKQYVRNWLDASGWDHESPPPSLPEEVVLGTLNRYVEAFQRITGSDPVF
ncbi:MAG: phosphoribosylaminoimidazolesuccinocarboxamide synthase [Acidobacteria bacterium]|nr:phosphoribosylaminoimidazolesuccinocarboxamide synthase [Acidobacteriota bacterium]